MKVSDIERAGKPVAVLALLSVAYLVGGLRAAEDVAEAADRIRSRAAAETISEAAEVVRQAVRAEVAPIKLELGLLRSRVEALDEAVGAMTDMGQPRDLPSPATPAGMPRWPPPASVIARAPT